MHIENIRIQNYRLFRRAELGNLPQLTIVVGANGSGKSTLFDVFTFSKRRPDPQCGGCRDAARRLQRVGLAG